MANKMRMTKADYFAQILSTYPLTDDERAFIEKEMELLARKNASKSDKPTANQIANEALKDAIYDGMEYGKQYTPTELWKTIPELTEKVDSNQKVTALLRQMMPDRVVRTEVKGKAYFSKV